MRVKKHSLLLWQYCITLHPVGYASVLVFIPLLYKYLLSGSIWPTVKCKILVILAFGTNVASPRPTSNPNHSLPPVPNIHALFYLSPIPPPDHE